ncbi:hypothetical protein SAMN05421835_102532 [Amycolatopsis sacchari]|uniref:Uncharacterized protein n=1 Tax=Amycolatopsis sacchari TaxID=115433 RepID=A0A1I3MYY8_9PSEU|nr:hypothetical protein [Amycolatopsis sacchari]SFJ02223.1 hypothetical protein SAMN05421835_102532 [Amycolatopsis sacchari]
MWADEQELGLALKEAVAGEGPPPGDHLEDVLRRGRRRVLLRRGGTIAACVLLVCGLCAGGFALRGFTAGPPPVGEVPRPPVVTAPPTTTTSSVDTGSTTTNSAPAGGTGSAPPSSTAGHTSVRSSDVGVTSTPSTSPSSRPRCTDVIDYGSDPRSNAEINSIGEETGNCPSPIWLPPSSPSYESSSATPSS